jgi:hypothetical protein
MGFNAPIFFSNIQPFNKILWIFPVPNFFSESDEKCIHCGKSFLHLSKALFGAENWTLREVYQKRLESFEMWCWRRMEKIIWPDHVRNEVLLGVKEQSNILHEIS